MGEPSQHRKLVAFVLDDNVRVSAFVYKMLTMIGMAAQQFVEPVEFLKQLRLSNPDVIVLDVALGKTDAVEIIRKLEVLNFRGKVLLISGHDASTLTEIERIGRAHGLCMLQSLRKPFRALELKNHLLAPPEHVAVQTVVTRSSSDQLPSQPRVDLEEALRNDRLEMWYQPKVDLRSLSICGAEALVRGRDPNGGVIGPAHLLPPTGDPLYQPLSRFVIRRAMADWVLFADQGFPLKLSINVPASILNAPDFVDIVRQMIPPDSRFPGLIIEVTEDEVIRDPQLVHEIATQLMLYKTTISIDDFGAAYASLSRLTDLPFGELKLDRSFVSNCGLDELRRGLCQTVVDLAHRFGATVCAEGVENEDDLRCLINLKFDTAQGFLFAKPMAVKTFTEFLLTRPKWDIPPQTKYQIA